jgi:hypothetical protein
MEQHNDNCNRVSGEIISVAQKTPDILEKNHHWW